MVKFSRILFALAALLPAISHGAAGMYDQYAFTSVNNRSLVFYDTGATTSYLDTNAEVLSRASRAMTPPLVGRCWIGCPDSLDSAHEAKQVIWSMARKREWSPSHLTGCGIGSKVAVALGIRRRRRAAAIRV